jgi:hypothetical protein
MLVANSMAIIVDVYVCFKVLSRSSLCNLIDLFMAFSMQVRHQQRDGNLAIIQAFVRSYWQNHKHWLVSLMGWVFCAYPLLIYEFEPCLLGFDIVSGE